MRSAAVLLGITLWYAGRGVSQEPAPRVVALYDKARADQARGADEDAIAAYLEILRLDPKLAAAYNNLGRIYYNLGRYAEAVPVLVKGLQLSPAMHPAEAMLGGCYFQMGAYAKAEPVLEAAVRAMPEDRFAGVTLARTLMQLRRPDKAVSLLQTLSKRQPNDQEIWYLLGKLQLQESEAAFQRVRAIDPESALSHELSGEILESMKNLPGAVAEYKKAVQAAPTDSDALEHLANAYWHEGEWPAARDGLEELLRQDPGNCLAHWRLANALDELAEASEEALGETDKALKLCPNLAQARVERARVLLRMSRYQEALPELLVAEKSAPEESSIQILLAKTYKGLGDATHAAAASARFEQLQRAEHQAEETHAAESMRAHP